MNTKSNGKSRFNYSIDNPVFTMGSTVAGGLSNSAYADFATVGGGHLSLADGQYSTVSGGDNNGAVNLSSTVGGGANNYAAGRYATVPGGYGDNATGSYSFAAGKQAYAPYPGDFVWSDSGGIGESTLISDLAQNIVGAVSVNKDFARNLL